MEDIIAKCEKCHCEFIQKYWDDEISWYIELNDKNICRACEAKSRLQANKNINISNKLGITCRGHSS